MISMKNYLFTALFLLLCLYASADKSCSSSEVYIKVLKQVQWNCGEESYSIKKDGVVVASSPIFAEGELRTSEFCLPASTNNQYVVEFSDNYGDSWDLGSWFEARGINGNVVLKTYMTALSTETHPISLYTPITKESQWKMIAGNALGTWKQVVYDTTGWSDVTLGSVANQVNGAQYFRKTFSTITGMVAYETQFKYRYGIVAYTNGVEVFRDNMLVGEVNSTTVAVGSYQSASYHGIIRPITEMVASSVLAVEVHYLVNNVLASVDFDAFIALYAPTETSGLCHVIGYTPLITASGVSTPGNACDFNRETAVSWESNAIKTIDYVYNQNAIPYVNGFRINPSYGQDWMPREIDFEGSYDSGSSAIFTSMFTAAELTFAEYTDKYVYSYFNSKLYKTYRLKVTEVSTTYVDIYEAEPCVCSTTPPSAITFAKPLYSYIIHYQSVLIRPVVREYSQCSILPITLPTGITLDAVTCVISGVPTTAMAQTVYTMSSTMNGITYTGTFTMETVVCTGTMTEFFRVYSYSSFDEGFTVKDSDTNTVLLSVALKTIQIDSVSVAYPICITASRITIVTECTYQEWSYKSYLYVNGMLSSTEREPLLRVHRDNYLGLPVAVHLNSAYSIAPLSQWFYKMNDPSGTWYNSETTGWNQAIKGSFPAPTNRIQLYKKAFTIASLADVAGYTVTMKYKYGCVIYMNGVEVFRNGVAAGPVTTTSEVTNFYSDVIFRTVSLPSKTMTIGTTAATAILTQGTNTIAIALVAMTDTQITVDFEATVYVMGQKEVSHVFEYTTVSDGGWNADDAFVFYYGTYFWSETCGENYVTILFNNDRRNWISSIVIQNYYYDMESNPVQFSVEARNGNSDEWHRLKDVTGLKWSLIGQTKKIWLENNTPYNQYRFLNFGTGDATKCTWKIQRLDLLSDNLAVDIPALSYQTPPIFKGIEMAEAYPSSTLFSDFSITPSLPEGLFIDPQVGVITGTSKDVSAVKTYTINARKAIGGTVTASISLGVEICKDSKSLITVVIRSDYSSEETSYSIFSGRGTTGTVVKHADRLPASFSFVYVDQCLPFGIYTVEMSDSYGDGIDFPGGYTMSADVGAMYFDVNMVRSIYPDKPSKSSLVFSSTMPFQMGYYTWKINKSTDDIPSNWKELDYDDSSWTSVECKAIGTSESITVYLRKTFTIDNLDDYSLLNVRIVYTGGVVAYFNGRKVARFNLIDEFTANSESMIVHDKDISSKFHIIFVTTGGRQGNNVITFEVHRPVGESSATNILFDATGLFGVADCSVVLDSLLTITSTTPTKGVVENIFDLLPYNTCVLPNKAGTNIEWTSDNLEGSRFNQFGFFVSLKTTSGWGFTLSARSSAEDEWTILTEKAGHPFDSRVLLSYDTPVAIGGYTSFKWYVDKASTGNPTIGTFAFYYCKATGEICPGDNEYPTVSDGQISPSVCAIGFRGYSYRECKNGKLGDINMSRCIMKTPANLLYDMPRYNLVKDILWTSNKPSYSNIISNFKIDSGELPQGLILDATTGIISGIPTETQVLSPVNIYGENLKGATKVTLNFMVHVGECKAEGSFPTTTVGTIASYECSSQGSYVGSQTRPCILGSKDGEWQKASGFCVSVFLLVIIVVVVIIIITVVIVILIRVGRKSKAVGGVKGKKKSSTKANIEKKSSVKTVKV